MAKLSVRSKKKGTSSSSSSGGLVRLRVVVEKLQKTLLMVRNSSSKKYYDGEEEGSCVPEDVKEGHFAVIAKNDEDGAKRFVMPLSCLSNPTFLRLLEEAAQEYGFDHQAALTIPCSPSVLHSILIMEQQQQQQQWLQPHATSSHKTWNNSSSCNHESMLLQSY